MSPTLIENVSIDDVLSVLAYLHAMQPIQRNLIADGLDILLAENGEWNIDELIEQVHDRADVFAGTAKTTHSIYDVTLGLNTPFSSYARKLERARKIKNILTGVLDLEPEIDMSEIPF